MLHTLHIILGSINLSVCACVYTTRQECPTVVWERATTDIEGWFAGRCVKFAIIGIPKRRNCRSQWPRGLRRRSAAARLLRSWVRIPPGAWMFVCCECCVLSGRGLCDELITRPEESYRLWYVVVCDLETSRMRRPWPALGRSATEREKKTAEITVQHLILYKQFTNCDQGRVTQPVLPRVGRLCYRI